MLVKKVIAVVILISIIAAGVVWMIPETRAKPNIILILADDLGWGDLGVYGHPYAQSPNIDKLASEGTLFRRFYSAGTVCATSRAGLMTSRNPATFPLYPGIAGLQGFTTVTELLKSGGYATGHFGKWHMGENRMAGTYGIDRISDRRTKTPGYVKSKDVIYPKARDSKPFRAATRFIEQHKSVPFYVNIWAHAMHAPNNPHPFFLEKFSKLVVNRQDFGSHMQPKFDDADSIGMDIDRHMAAYLGELYALDMLIGELLESLEDLGLRNNTIVAFSSDQGPARLIVEKRKGRDDPLSANRMGYAGGLRGWKAQTWEGGIRSPFIVRWPGMIPAGRVNEHSVISSLDWLPTVASIAGISYNEDQFEGENVLDIWQGSDRSRHNPLIWGTYRDKNRVSMLQGDWKYHTTHSTQTLYNLAEDPEEDMDLSLAHPNVAKALKVKTAEWVNSWPNDNRDRAYIVTPANLPDSLAD